jgi:hypothetical protein
VAIVETMPSVAAPLAVATMILMPESGHARDRREGIDAVVADRVQLDLVPERLRLGLQVARHRLVGGPDELRHHRSGKDAENHDHHERFDERGGRSDVTTHPVSPEGRPDFKGCRRRRDPFPPDLRRGSPTRRSADIQGFGTF